MINIRVRADLPTSQLTKWLAEQGISCDYENYSVEMAGIELTDDGDIEFFPEFCFNSNIDTRILTEFSLRFS